jgi:hypothetical protein
MHRPSVKSVPSELLYTGYHWETTRENYFAQLGNWEKANVARELRKLYADRLWHECGVTVDLEKGFA